MMSQSEDNTSFAMWNNCDFWNASMSNELERADLWAAANKFQNGANLAKLNGICMFLFFALIRQCLFPRRSLKTQLMTASKQTAWILVSHFTVGSALNDVDIPSIWWPPELYISNDPNLSLSGQPVPWPPVSHSASEDIDSNTSVECWDSSREPPLFSIPGLDSDGSAWKPDQQVQVSLPESNCGVPTSVAPAIPSSNRDVHANFGALRLESDDPVLEPGSPPKNPVSDDSNSLTAFSTEQLCDHLINSNEGWGRRPVDQTIPWDSSGVTKPSEGVGRSGITTPTPGSCSAPNLGASYRVALQAHSVESNVWTNEPPTGTGIWEMYYENCGARSAIWHPPTSSPSNPASISSQGNANALSLLNNLSSTSNLRTTPQTPTPLFGRTNASQRPWDSCEKSWPVNCSNASGGRPLLGGARSVVANVSQPEVIATWCADAVSLGGSTPLEGGGTANSWDGFSGNAGALQWSSSMASGTSLLPSLMFSGSDDVKRQQSTTNPNAVGERMLVPPFSNTYRADLVKYLMNQGFKKEDVQSALIDCNMEPERALLELRERYNPYPFSLSGTVANFTPTGLNGVSHFQNSSNFVTPGPQHTLAGMSNGANSVGNSNPLLSTNRTKFTAGSVMTPNQMMSIGAPPNPQLMRQQITQQVRSALNLSLPNPLGNGAMSAAHASIGAAGNSLLGQPPPPLLSGGGVLPCVVGPSASTPGASSQSHLRTTNIVNGNTRFAQTVPSVTKRSDRQMAIIVAIHELQRKYQSIHQQINMYKNNPTMCSQPQYADVFAELQGQMQQIEAQLKAKQAQLNSVYAQDCVSNSLSRAFPLAPRIVDGSRPVLPLSPNNGNSNCLFPPNRATQDPLVQQLMDLRLNPTSGSSGNVDGDTDFPTIGTWTSHAKGNSDVQDKVLLHEGSAPRFLTGMRSNSAKIGGVQTLANWTANNWQPNSVRAIPSNGGSQPNWQPSNISNAPRHLDGAGHTNATAFKVPNATTSGADQSLMTGQQWLLVQPVTSNGGGVVNPNLNVLHTLFSQYGLTHFHVLNPSVGSVLIRLQSAECALHLIRNFSDRLSVELVTDNEAVAHIQQRFGQNTNTRSDHYVGQFSPSGETGPSSHWMNTDPFPSSTGVFASKKPPNSHNGSRLGVMVSGIH
ncbi:UBA/TS-N domain protein [Paragonimus heterotremus]|uniref:UBA/TS-N domain protein n=1 Tax=Paragonimus heterotremus TaxID=100268 RepID=A0A8J4SPZ6_9TREM|nr:UBA/TS-N domain protein [Paragonimus heterotremus]